MDDVLTFKEIERRFDGEWVLVGDPVLSPRLKVLRGRVLAHSRDRDEVYGVAVRLRPRKSAMLCFAKIPKGAVVVLGPSVSTLTPT